MNRITHFINGTTWNGTADRKGDVYNPATGVVTGQVDFADNAVVDQAVAAASAAADVAVAAASDPKVPRRGRFGCPSSVSQVASLSRLTSEATTAARMSGPA